MNTVTIGNRAVGTGQPCYVIAEAGSNHNGDIGIARKMIDVAVEAGADAVKFQIFSAKTLYSKYTPAIETLKEKDTYELIRSIETPRAWIGQLADYCRSRNIHFLATPFDFAAVDELDPHVPGFKIASFEIVDLELIRHAAGKGKPMIMSTGMADLGEIEDAVSACQSVNNNQIVLLHCNSLYPTPPEVVNLNSMVTMGRALQLPVGFSDHTEGIHIPISAVSMGACVIEKHFTLDRTMEGPDHAFAIEPDELRSMVGNIRDLEKAMGSGEKGVSELERQENYVVGRRSIHASRDIKEGEEITRDMLIVKRPAYGIKPKEMERLVGCRARKDIKEDQWITWDMVVQ